jgi:hypothetical protein
MSKLQTCESKDHNHTVVVWDDYDVNECLLCKAMEQIKDLSEENESLKETIKEGG